MDNKNVKPLWEPDAEYRELRRPKTLEPLNADNSIKDKPTSTSTNNLSSVPDVAKNSTLSVEAKEWYPPGYMNTSSTNNYTYTRNFTSNHSVQNRLTKYRQAESEVKVETSEFDQEMEYLNEIINTLTKNPGEFDTLVCELLEILEPEFKNIEVISRVTSAIFKQALAAQNFQYSGVRLFAVLDESCPLVRGCLHTLCQKELETTKNLQSILLFYAEIYSKLNFELFGKCLLKVLENLKPNADNVKNICQTLKITGGKLESLDKPLITDLLKQLDNLRPTLNSSMSFLVESVIKLRNSQWGQSDTQTITPPAEPYEWPDGPVFYGPDGLQLTAEESEFLAENLNEFIIDDSDPDGLWNPEQEMDEEIREAFVEFVRSNDR